jgi:restriction system protein
MSQARRKKKTGAKFIQYFAPLLDALRTLGGSGTPDEVVERIARDLKIPENIQDELLPSGEGRFRNQIRWARHYLAKEGLIDSSERGVWSLTESGQRAHLSMDDSRRIHAKYVHRDERERAASKVPVDDQESSPDQAAPDDDHAARVINILRSLSPSGFERFSQRLLREAGFTQVVVTGQSGDGGIDGHGNLQIGPLLTLKALFQCKRYKGSVSAPDVRDFRGAMDGRTDRGIMITTGTFTTEARREASRDGAAPIELIDSEKLVEMLRKLQLGLRPVTSYEVDEPFFEEFKTNA